MPPEFSETLRSRSRPCLCPDDTSLQVSDKLSVWRPWQLLAQDPMFYNGTLVIGKICQGETARVFMRENNSWNHFGIENMSNKLYLYNSDSSRFVPRANGCEYPDTSLCNARDFSSRSRKHSDSASTSNSSVNHDPPGEIDTKMESMQGFCHSTGWIGVPNCFTEDELGLVEDKENENLDAEVIRAFYDMGHLLYLQQTKKRVVSPVLSAVSQSSQTELVMGDIEGMGTRLLMYRGKMDRLSTESASLRAALTEIARDRDSLVEESQQTISRLTLEILGLKEELDCETRISANLIRLSSQQLIV